ncbi:MAG: RNA polymerase sigma factor [Sphingobacteriaceae bacterium]|nr:RNA polymerase sigma factor [Sphingobacteriaceae bacterium]
MNEVMLQIPSSFKERLVEEISTLKRLASSFAKDIQDAEDLVQDTVYKALLCYNRFEYETNFKGWLYVLMRNIYINNYRKINLYRRFTEAADDEQLTFFTSRVYQNDGEESLAMKDIDFALKGLNAQESAPLKMLANGYKYREIAAWMKLPIGTIKTRIHVARAKLKSALKDYYQYV